MIHGSPNRIQATARTPCPVCERVKSCSWEEGGLLFCMGIQDSPAPDGWAFVDRGQFDKHGFRHLKRDDGRASEPRVTFDPTARTRATFSATASGKPLTAEQRRALADHLAVPNEALDAMPFRWDGKAWTFPEVDGGGNVVGISRRFPDGSKKQVAGGRRGLTVFAGWREKPGPLLVCEGMSDGLAITHAGLAAVSRANARDGADELAEFLRDWPRGREVVFVADADEVGTDGATAVAAQVAESLGRPIRVVTPPDEAKDARAWLTHPDRGETPWAERGKVFLQLIETTAAVIDSPAPGVNAPLPGSHQSEWPAPPAEEAFHGLMGEIVRTLEPETEADPVALLVQGLVMFGNVVGRNAYLRVEDTPHYTNMFAALVGSTSNGRKGTSHGRMKPLFRGLDEDWLHGRNVSGTSSAEGLVTQVRDANPQEDDPGESDKRLMLTEPEFSTVLKQTERQGNTASAYLRQFWDGTEVVGTLTKKPVKATAAHVSMIAHITPEELLRGLTATETANGFANRYLFVYVHRSKFLPFGGCLSPSALPPLVTRMEAAAGSAQAVGEITWHPSARPLWAAVYPILSGERNGLAGSILARAAPHALRLALLYALLDRSGSIRPCHLMAALALWDFCERSANFLFGDRTGNPLADEIRELLRNAPVGLTRSELVAALGRHTFGDKLTSALNALQSSGLARCERKTDTGGKPSERWHATHRPAAESVLMATARRALTGCDESDQSPPPPFRRFHRICRSPDEPTAIFSGASKTPPPPRAPKPAELLLVNQLRNGPRFVSEVEAEAKKALVTKGEIRAAGLVLQVSRDEVKGEYQLRLPIGFDFTPYPAPPEPPEPTLMDEIEPPPTPAEAKPSGKKKRNKAKKQTASGNPAPSGPPSAEQVEVMLRKAKRTWAEVAAYLDELEEYYPTDSALYGLTPKQLQLVADWLAEAEVRESGSSLT